MKRKEIRLLSLLIISLCIAVFIVFPIYVLQIFTLKRNTTSADIKIATTVGMLSDIVRAVSTHNTSVTHIIGTGIDPHSYIPSRSDIETLLKSDIIVYVGLYLEGQLGPAIEKLKEEGHSVFSVESILKKEELLSGNTTLHFDPHIWMDVSLWYKVARSFADYMTTIDPARANQYSQNVAQYSSELGKLDQYVRDISKTVDPEKRIIITAHDAFQYFGKAYGYTVIGIQGISTASEASIKKINNLVSLIVSHKIDAIFVESSVSPKYVQALLEGAHARGHMLHIGASLFSDSMGSPGTYEGTYIGMLDHNATMIVRSLGGTAPLSGFQGMLVEITKK